MQEALQVEKARLLLVLGEEERAVSAAQQQHSCQGGVPGQEAGDGEHEDELDAFMGQVAVRLEQDKVGCLLLLLLRL